MSVSAGGSIISNQVSKDGEESNENEIKAKVDLFRE
jgi:hypothetical protein